MGRANENKVRRSSPLRSLFSGLRFRATELTFHLGQLPHEHMLLLIRGNEESIV